jgi:CubicO group peptidase (beta-lactamase class C family)
VRILRIFVRRLPRPHIGRRDKDMVGEKPHTPPMTRKFLCTMAFCLAASLASLGQTSPAAVDRAQRLQRVEAAAIEVGGRPDEAPVRLSLAELMKTYAVPGLSLAVIENYKIVDAKAYGVIEPRSKIPVTTKTLFQAGSISKPVAAAGALSLVEQGKLALDEDVNQKLKTWKVPENEFTKTEKVTLRRLMSHTGGLTVHGFPGYDINDARPTLVQVLNGEKPANTAPIRADIVPGTEARYSGGGVTIEQLLMMDVTGKPFPVLMRELVLDKIGMSDSSYEQPLPPARAAMTAGGTSMNGKAVPGRWHIYPEMAAAGLWTTPTDLAKFAIEIALSKQGKSKLVLSQKMTEEMLTPVKDGVGLGLFLEKDNPGQFGHDGADEGFQALLTMNAATGNGIAMMADSDNGISLMNAVLRRVVKEYGWNYKIQFDSGDELYLVAKVVGLATALDRYEAIKQTTRISPKEDEANLNGFAYRLLFSGSVSDAVQVFERNVKQYPQSSNVYDSLGEAYIKAGEKEKAIQNYEKSLELDPKNDNAKERLKKLKGSE